MPPAPERLSITICWPQASVRRCAIARAVKSLALPAEPGTMTRIGRTGYVCAETSVVPAQAVIKENSSRLRIVLSPSLNLHLRFLHHCGRFLDVALPKISVLIAGR